MNATRWTHWWTPKGKSRRWSLWHMLRPDGSLACGKSVPRDVLEHRDPADGDPAVGRTCWTCHVKANAARTVIPPGTKIEYR